jgi:hypothetical protein
MLGRIIILLYHKKWLKDRNAEVAMLKQTQSA